MLAYLYRHVACLFSVFCLLATLSGCQSSPAPADNHQYSARELAKQWHQNAYTYPADNDAGYIAPMYAPQGNVYNPYRVYNAQADNPTAYLPPRIQQHSQAAQPQTAQPQQHAPIPPYPADNDADYVYPGAASQDDDNSYSPANRPLYLDP